MFAAVVNVSSGDAAGVASTVVTAVGAAGFFAFFLAFLAAFCGGRTMSALARTPPFFFAFALTLVTLPLALPLALTLALTLAFTLVFAFFTFLAAFFLPAFFFVAICVTSGLVPLRVRSGYC